MHRLLRNTWFSLPKRLAPQKAEYLGLKRTISRKIEKKKGGGYIKNEKGRTQYGEIRAERENNIQQSREMEQM